MKKSKKNKNDDLGNTKEIIDLTKFIYPDMVNLDDNGSYTGVTKQGFFDGKYDNPVQDADDL